MNGGTSLAGGGASGCAAGAVTGVSGAVVGPDVARCCGARSVTDPPSGVGLADPGLFLDRAPATGWVVTGFFVPFCVAVRLDIAHSQVGVNRAG
ncbi:hypothetical protein [Cellulomonas sp. URHE0023]|uniref:hypothetical protein n=1 Tax=Cellulomonas sp. URHE0023 TaxID=1380354 RepID=UPI000558B17E|nr:hypothetical protein [Cellulomonas sp. URHE0023]